MYKVFTDGSSSRKTKTIGTAYVVFQNEESEPIKEFSRGFKDSQARNGIAELLGVYYFLYDLCCAENIYLNQEEEIIIYSDSQYVVKEFTEWFRNQMMKNFFDTKNREVIIYVLWMLHILRNEGFKIKFQWIRGHQKEESFEAYGNNCADNLAVQCHNEAVLFGNTFSAILENSQKIDLKDIENFVSDLRLDIKEEDTLNFIKKAYLGI